MRKMERKNTKLVDSLSMLVIVAIGLGFRYLLSMVLPWISSMLPSVLWKEIVIQMGSKALALGLGIAVCDKIAKRKKTTLPIAMPVGFVALIFMEVVAANCTEPFAAAIGLDKQLVLLGFIVFAYLWSARVIIIVQNLLSKGKNSVSEKSVSAWSKGRVLLLVSVALTCFFIFDPLDLYPSLYSPTVAGLLAFFPVLGIIAGFSMLEQDKIEVKKDEEAEWNRMYNDAEWRKNNPVKAAIIEEKRKREDLKWNGPAVSIRNIQAGYFDPGSAYRASSWNTWANAAGGWSVRYKIVNIGARTIKYVYITFAAYNAVGDKCVCRVRRQADATIKYTGPLSPGCETGWTMGENQWYDISMSRVAVEHIYVEFMDGKSQDIAKNGAVTNHGF